MLKNRIPKTFGLLLPFSGFLHYITSEGRFLQEERQQLFSGLTDAIGTNGAYMQQVL
jgi:hypothetical protein